MTATVHIFCPRTRRQLFAIPCVTIDLARTIANVQDANLNVVHCGDIWIAYAHGRTVAFGPAEVAAWLRAQNLNTDLCTSRNQSSALASLPRSSLACSPVASAITSARTAKTENKL